MHFKSHLSQPIVIQNITAIKYKRRLRHVLVNPFKVQILELIPLGQHCQCVSAIASRICIRGRRHRRFQPRMRGFAKVTRVIHFPPHVFPRHLRIVYVNLCLLHNQIAHNEHGRRLAHISRVLLEGIPQNGNLFPRDGVKHAGNHLLRKALLLVVVHDDNLVPVLGALIQTVRLTEVDQVKDIFLEARSAESDRGVEEALPDASVHSHGARDLGNVGAGRFAQRRDGIDRRHALGEEGVGHQLRQLRRPQVGSENLFLRHPIRVHRNQRRRRLNALGTLHPSNEHAIRLHQIGNRRTLRQKLGIAQHLKL
mmetsp:Transcript_6070/g.11072  ORF Transcript_6070/g.11072 Transcript_6070/m.11072 type:complete len:310 (-) Transcript_6070:1243-2172(-)